MKKAIVACLLLHSIFVMSEKIDDALFDIEFKKEYAGFNFKNGYLALTKQYAHTKLHRIS